MLVGNEVGGFVMWLQVGWVALCRGIFKGAIAG